MTKDYEYHFGVLYLDQKSMLEHMNQQDSYSPTLRYSKKVEQGQRFVYDYVSGTDIMEFCAKEWDGFICLEGSYASEVINFAMSRVRRVVTND